MALQHRYHPDATRSWTLPAEAYVAPDVLAAEMKTIFAHAWAFAAHAGEVAESGAFVVAEAAGREVLLVRGGDGVLRAFGNLCPRRPHVLAQGRGTAREFACHRHGVVVGLDGAFAEGALRPLRVETLASLVFVNPDLDAAPLAAGLDGFEAELRARVPELDRLVFADRIATDFRANWKVMIDNSVECYHCAVAHPDFVGLLDLDSYRIVNHRRYATHTGRAGRGDNSAYGYDETDSVDFASWWLWPNLLMGPFPGRSNLTVHRILPTGPETARELFDFYFLDAEPDEQERAAVAFFRDVLRPQDVALCESVQRGLRSRAYREGRIVDDAEGSADSERNVHLFHGLVLEALGAR
jgi:choline monooxygenase